MLDTMTLTKIVGGFCGSLLVFMMGSWIAELLYHVGHGHGEDHVSGYAIEVEVVEIERNEEEIDFDELLAAADIGKGAKVFGKCKACHKLGDGENGTGPHLYNIIDREMAVISDFKYSSSFKALNGNWTYDELNQFLTKPSNYVKGTAMNFAGLGKVSDRANLIAYLEDSTK